MPIELVDAEFPGDKIVSDLEDAYLQGELSHDLMERLSALVSDCRLRLGNAASDGESQSELSPEQIDRLLFDLETRFIASGKISQQSINWRDVEDSIRANKMALLALQSLEATGGIPTFVGVDGNDFVFQRSSGKSIPKGLQCSIRVANCSL